MYIIFLLIFNYWSGNVAKRRETLKYGTFGRKKFGFRAMSRRILNLCVASLLNILCFPGHLDNVIWLAGKYFEASSIQSLFVVLAGSWISFHYIERQKNECQHLFLGRHWGWCFCIFKIQNFKRYAINHRSVNCQQNFLFQRFSYLTLPSVWTFSYFFIVSYFSLYIVSYFIVTVGATPLFPPRRLSNKNSWGPH